MRTSNFRFFQTFQKAVWVLILFGFCSFQNTYSQSFCPNVDFSSGNFDNWEGYYGLYENPEMFYGFVPRRHTIITTRETDPFTCGGLMTIPAGETISARLGNVSVFSEAEQLRYTYTVTPENDLFIYNYAVILEDPGHIPEHQPNFTIEVRNEDGVVFDLQCGYYYVYAQLGLPGWHSCTGSVPVLWKDWTTVGMDLSPLMGETVTIVFTTRDCQEGAHFGYAYISAHCMKLQLAVGYCIDKTFVTVTAPPGFSYLWDSGETTQSIVLTNPEPGMVTSCKLTALNGCEVTIQATIQPTFLTADFIFEPQCALTEVTFSDLSTINQNFIAEWEWDFGDGTPIVRGTPIPTHIYSEPGTYNVELVIQSSDSCINSVTKTITIIPYTSVDLGADINIRKDESIKLDAGNPGSEYLWSTGETTREINTSGEQTVWVKVSNEYCSESDTVQIFILPGCTAEMPNAFSPNGDGQNDLIIVYGSSISNYELQIYDRSGEMVFKTVNISTGWDGTFNGRALEIGVYNYLLNVVCNDGFTYTKKGNITLLR